MGEKVELGYTTSPAGITPVIDWRMYSGLGFVDDPYFYAGAYGGTVQIRAWIDAGPSKNEFRDLSRTVVEPDNNSYMKQIIYAAPQHSVAHDTGNWSVGFLGEIFLTPKDVSFRYILFREGGGTSDATGWLEPDFKNKEHEPTKDVFGNNAAAPVSGGNLQTGSKVLFPSGEGDAVGAGSYPRLPPAAPFGSGTFTWPIEWIYVHYDPRPGYNIWTEEEFMTATMYITSDANGRATVSKAGSGTIAADATDTTTAPPNWPGFPYPDQR